MFGGIELDFKTLLDVLDILIVAYLIYRLLLVIRGTRAAPMLIGLSVIVVIYVMSRQFGFITLGWLLENFLSSLILIVVVVFQDEIRRALTKVGLQRVFKKEGKTLYDKTIEDITLVSSQLSKNKLGGLIVIQREVGLEEFVEDAVILDARLNRKLLYSLFVRESSLHDGAVLIDRDSIRAAGAVLPLSFNPDLDPNLGTRHRAALGLSERSDAIIIVISEETGAISLVRDGRIIRNLDASVLRDSLHRFLSEKSESEEEADSE